METTNDILHEIRDSLHLLLMIELSKAGANRDQVRELLGSMNNNLLAKVNAVVKSKG